MTDYNGLGPVGELHPYLSKAAEGNAVIDAVRAVRRLPGAHADPRTTEPARSIILGNDVGNVAVKKVPLLLASGTLDDRVVIDRTRDLFDRLCANGQVTEFVVVDGADHGSVIPLTSAQVTDFLEDRFARREPVDSCPSGR